MGLTPGPVGSENQTQITGRWWMEGIFKEQRTKNISFHMWNILL